MNRIWLVTNAASGTFSSARLEALEAQLARLGVVVVESSDFPRADLPSPERLEAADIDTLALFAGDGSIAAAVAHSSGWPGKILVLPGGTMNLLAKHLHGDRDVEDIVDAVAEQRAVPKRLPGIRVGEAHALVGVIAGPVAAWSQAREDVREGALGKLPASIVDAVRETVAGEGVRVAGIERTHRAVLVFADGERLTAYTPAPESAKEALQLGWHAITGDWRDSPGVESIAGPTILLDSDAGVDVLADGEPVELAPPVTLTHAMTTQHFHATEDA